MFVFDGDVFDCRAGVGRDVRVLHRNERVGVVSRMTKHEIPIGCFDCLIYESDETFDMMTTIFFPILPLVITFMLGFTGVNNWGWTTQLALIVIIWIVCLVTGFLWNDMR